MIPWLFLVQGDRDVPVPIEEGQTFHAALREAVPGQVVHPEIPGGAARLRDLSLVRTTFAIHGVERLLAWVYSCHPMQMGQPGREAAVG